MSEEIGKGAWKTEEGRGADRSRGGALNVESITSWTTSASFLISVGERTFLMMSILTRGILTNL